MKKFTDTFVLSNGVEVPCIGYGTWQSPDGEETKNAVKSAIECGYRHIDTASAYGNEASVGDAIKESGVAREEIFITTKHWVTERGYEKTVAAAEASLKALGVDYLDLYLIHWPAVAKFSPEWKEINASTWRGFEKLYKDGKIRAIGLSNFHQLHIDALNEFAEIKPMVNQIEFHPGFTQMEVVEYSKKSGMLVQAWSPLGSGAVLSDPTVNEIAQAHGKSAAHVCIKYALQNGINPLTKSMNPSRMADNMNVFDFELTADDLKKLDSMPITGYTGWHPEDAPADALAGTVEE